MSRRFLDRLHVALWMKAHGIEPLYPVIPRDTRPNQAVQQKRAMARQIAVRHNWSEDLQDTKSK